MTSTPSIPGKSLSASPSPAAQSGSSPSTTSFDASARRPSQASSTGTSSISHAAPRKGQAARKQHRSLRRPGQMGPGGVAGRHGRSLDDDDALAEMSVVRNPSSRRGQTSITHLMNYALPPRPYQTHHHGGHHDPYSRSYRRNPTWGPGSGHHAVDKARYVHANYRFVVSPEGSYTAQAADADEHLRWSDVLQVLASAESQQASCPICLSEPVAPRMANCGHIFCLSCLIRFMNSNTGDDDGRYGRGTRWKKCPICEDAVYLHEVRPVRFYAGQESPLPRPGDDVVLRLMARKAHSTLALPWEGGADGVSVTDDIPWHFAANVIDYARIMMGTGDYMAAQYDAEIEALLKQEKEDELLFHEDGEWAQKAIKAVQAAKEKSKDLGKDRLALPVAAGLTRKSAEPDYYFYTSPPHLYLSPLDIRILKTKYGSFSSFPSALLPRVEHISTGHVVDDALRKRAKYLGHLPHGCVITFLECDWTDIVPAETLAGFGSEIAKRRERNNEKAAQEERERAQSERLEAAQIRGSMGTGRRGATSHDDDHEPRPVMDYADFLPLSGGYAGTTPPDSRPGFGPLASMSTSPSAQRTVWGTVAVAGSPELAPAVSRSDFDDGWLKDEDLHGTAQFVVEMDALVLDSGVGGDIISSGAASGPSIGGGGNTPASGGGGKKKKKQKITLMSTGGRRGT